MALAHDPLQEGDLDKQDVSVKDADVDEENTAAVASDAGRTARIARIARLFRLMRMAKMVAMIIRLRSGEVVPFWQRFPRLRILLFKAKHSRGGNLMKLLFFSFLGKVFSGR